MLTNDYLTICENNFEIFLLETVEQKQQRNGKV